MHRDGSPFRRHIGRRTTSLEGTIVFIGLFILAIFVAAHPHSSGQEKNQDIKWTTESHDRTNFPLQGKHRTLSCRDCHINNVFEGTPPACEVCHWERRQDDRYSLRLGIRCGECHTPQSWKKIDPGRWNHETEAGFRLEGTHRALDCEACHGTGGFQELPPACYSCHAEDYQRTRDPDHGAVGFPTTCENCHSSRIWEDAEFRHSSYIPEGRHRTASCSDCHASGVYSGMSRECSACHLGDYTNTRDPQHQTAGFPVTCEDCHSPAHTSWQQATFNHAFAISSGRHSGLQCTDCHTTSNFQQFSCLNCHAHDKSDMDEEHGGESGYVYTSQACYTCHPQGRG